MNNSKWFYCFNADCGNDFSELGDFPENPSHDELDVIAQKLLRDYGYTDAGDYVCIGKGKLVTIEDLGDCLGIEIIEMLDDNATLFVCRYRQMKLWLRERHCHIALAGMPSGTQRAG